MIRSPGSGLGPRGGGKGHPIGLHPENREVFAAIASYHLDHRKNLDLGGHHNHSLDDLVRESLEYMVVSLRTDVHSMHLPQ